MQCGKINTASSESACVAELSCSSLLDFRTAFDSILRNKLWDVLTCIGMQGNNLKQGSILKLDTLKLQI